MVFSDIPFSNANVLNEVRHSLKFLWDFDEKDVFNINNSEIIIKSMTLKRNFIILFITT